MATINIINDSTYAANSDVMSVCEFVQTFVNQVTQAWAMPHYTVKFATASVAGDWNVFVVDKFPNPAMTNIALGYHEIDSSGSPVAYIRANSYGKRSLLGTYSKPFVLLGKQITPARYTPGVCTVIMHEIAEMLIDAHVDQYSTDSTGRQWLMEICDHAYPVCYNIPDATNKINAIAPDFTWPNFYKVGAKGPYSYCNTPTLPFTLPKGAYGYYKNGTGVTALPTADRVADVE